MSSAVGSPRWTPEDDERLRSLALLGKRPTQIAEQLKRSEPAIRSRANKLGILLGVLKVKRK